MASEATVPSPYNTLVNFSFDMMNGDTDSAADWVTEPSVLDEAAAMFPLPSREGNCEYPAAATDATCQIYSTYYDVPLFTLTLVKSGDNWRISSIEVEVTPAPS